MADLLDLAAEQQALVEEAQIQRIRNQAGPIGAGYCLNCGEILAPANSFCDQDCRDDHNKRQRMKGYAQMV